MLRFIGDHNIQWQEIDNAIVTQNTERTTQYEGGTLFFEASLYDIIVSAIKENRTAIGMLDFFNNLYGDLATNLSETEKKLVIETTKKVLKSLNMNYLNFFGEIATVNALKKRGEYILEGMEFMLDNSNKIDFILRRTKDHKINLVEVLNIHVDDDRVNEDKEQIKKFFNYRLEQKIKNKKANLKNDVEFILVPVLWGSAKSLRVYYEYFKTESLEIKNTIEPLCYATFTDEEQGIFHHRFGRISTVFNNG